jgi:hypothetical protein
MRKKIKIFIIIAILFFVFVIMFIPFVNSTDELNHFCRYRFAIYECWICESEGEGCTSGFYLFNVELGEKIGGPLEYFGIKEIKKNSFNKLK